MSRFIDLSAMALLPITGQYDADGNLLKQLLAGAEGQARSPYRSPAWESARDAYAAAFRELVERGADGDEIAETITLQSQLFELPAVAAY